MGEYLLASGAQPLDGQLFQPFAKPVQARIGAFIFKWKNQENSLRGRDPMSGGRCGLARRQTAQGPERSQAKNRREFPAHGRNCSRAPATTGKEQSLVTLFKATS